jgi:hypothetical protein
VARPAERLASTALGCRSPDKDEGGGSSPPRPTERPLTSRTLIVLLRVPPGLDHPMGDEVYWGPKATGLPICLTSTFASRRPVPWQPARPHSGRRTHSFVVPVSWRDPEQTLRRLRVLPGSSPMVPSPTRGHAMAWQPPTVARTPGEPVPGPRACPPTRRYDRQQAPSGGGRSPRAVAAIGVGWYAAAGWALVFAVRGCLLGTWGTVGLGPFRQASNRQP